MTGAELCNTLFRLSKVSLHVQKWMQHHYLLVDEVFIVAFYPKFSLCLLDFRTLPEECAIDVKHLFSNHLSLLDHGKELSCVFEFFPHLAKLLCTLRITVSCFPYLAELTSPETYIWICVVRVLTGFKLQTRR